MMTSNYQVVQGEDEALVRRMRGGDGAAFAALTARYLARLESPKESSES